MRSSTPPVVASPPLHSFFGRRVGSPPPREVSAVGGARARSRVRAARLLAGRTHAPSPGPGRAALRLRASPGERTHAPSQGRAALRRSASPATRRADFRAGSAPSLRVAGLLARLLAGQTSGRAARTTRTCSHEVSVEMVIIRLGALIGLGLRSFEAQTKSPRPLLRSPTGRSPGRFGHTFMWDERMSATAALDPAHCRPARLSHARERLVAGRRRRSEADGSG